MMVRDSDSAVFYADRLYRRGGVAFIKIDKSLTYRGDRSPDIYQSQKNFPGV